MDKKDERGKWKGEEGGWIKGGGKFRWYGQARVVVFFFLFFWTPFFSSAEKIKDKSHWLLFSGFCELDLCVKSS